MSVVKYTRASAYVGTPQTSWYLENLTLRELLPDPTDTLYTIPTKYHMRPYNLSFDLYGSKDYWWVFMTMNLDQIRDPINDFTAGKVIRIPTKDRLSVGITLSK